MNQEFIKVYCLIFFFSLNKFEYNYDFYSTHLVIVILIILYITTINVFNNKILDPLIMAITCCMLHK